MINQYIKKTRSHSKISEVSQPSLKKLKIEPKIESKKINFDRLKTEIEDLNRLTRQKKTENIKKPANTIIEIPISEKKKLIKPKQKNNIDKKENIRINLEKYTQAIERLQEYSLPDCIPCRESEKNSIEEFLIDGLQKQGSQQFLYIYGVPGIGKTISFLEVIRNLQRNEDYSDKFVFIHLNGMKLKNPENAYVEIFKELIGSEAKITKTTAELILNDLFTKNRITKGYSTSISASLKQKTKIILFDELDYFLTKDQRLLYNFADWFQHSKKSKLILAGIANTLDFLEKLQPKLRSRMGEKSLPYKPYSNNQIEEIINERIRNMTDVFAPEALTFASKRIATNSSDIRRTLNVIRKAAEISMENYRKEIEKEDHSGIIIPVCISDIRQSYDLFYSKPYHTALKMLNKWQKFMIIALGLEIKNRDKNFGVLSNIVDRVGLMIRNMGMNSKELSYHDIFNMFVMMQEIKIVNLKEKLISQKDVNDENLDPNKKGFSNIVDIYIEMNLTIDDITNSLKDDDIFLKFKELF